MQKLMRQLAILPLAGFLALLPAAAAPAPSQAAARTATRAASFVISQHGHAVGNASFNFAANAHGCDSTSVVRFELKGLNYALSKTERLSTASHLRHAQLSAAINGSAVNVTATSDSTRILLNFSANGRTSSIGLTPRAIAVFLPDFDPGALETLLTLAADQNNRDLWAILPKKSGTQAATVQSIQIATNADEQGTLDGNPIPVHHLVVTIAGAKTELFSGPENQLLQAELPQQGFALVRNGFVLTPPTKAGAPPTK